MENTNIVLWYIKEFPADELGYRIDSEVTFIDLFDALDNYKDVYKLLGVDDSIIRERVFGQLAKIMKVDYSYIYDQWLKA